MTLSISAYVLSTSADRLIWTWTHPGLKPRYTPSVFSEIAPNPDPPLPRPILNYYWTTRFHRLKYIICLNCAVKYRLSMYRYRYKSAVLFLNTRAVFMPARDSTHFLIYETWFYTAIVWPRNRHCRNTNPTQWTYTEKRKHIMDTWNWGQPDVIFVYTNTIADHLAASNLHGQRSWTEITTRQKGPLKADRESTNVAT
jgi:hypothetical protein